MGRLDRLLDVVIRMRGRDEEGFVLAAGEVDSAVDQIPEELGVSGGVGLGCGVPIGYRMLIEEEREHAAEAWNGVRNACCAGRLRKALGKSGAE